MSHARRMSESFSGSWIFEASTTLKAPEEDSQQWIADWRSISARDIIASKIVKIDCQTTVEEACNTLLSEDSLCLCLTREEQDVPIVGLFDFSDVNAFLTLAATRHTFAPEDLRDNHREIVAAARAGRVPVELVSNLSQKNPLVILSYDATIISLLEQFSRGSHRVLIRGLPPSTELLGMVSDRCLLAWFSTYASETPSFQAYLSNPLSSLGLPSLNLDAAVIAATSRSTVLDAMKLMSEEGVSSIAVVDEETESLLSAVSVTDIGKVVVPSESKYILSAPLQQFITHIKAPHGSTDGAESYPVYSVTPSSALHYTIQKLLATNAHRLFVTKEEPGTTSPMASYISKNLSGIVSIVDILALFARAANVENVDPTRMQRHRRASSASSSQSSISADGSTSSRPSSRTSVRKSMSQRSQKGALNRASRTSFSSVDSPMSPPFVP